MKRLIFFTSLIALCLSCSEKIETTRGIGVYPGDPDEFFGPEMIQDATYRNIALNRAVWHSTSYDYNLTGHLATDGIVSDKVPYYMAVVTSDGVAEKRDRERIMDENTTRIEVKGSKDAFLRLDVPGNAFDADEIVFKGTLTCPKDAKGYNISIEGSNDGENWTVLSRSAGAGKPGDTVPPRGMAIGGGSQNVAVSAGLAGIKSEKIDKPGPPAAKQTSTMRYNMGGGADRPESRAVNYSASIPEGSDFQHYIIRLESPSVINWTFTEIEFHKQGEYVRALPSESLNSAWMSAGAEKEWIYVDLGASASFDKIKVYWLAKANATSVETSENGKDWNAIAQFPQGSEMIEELAVNGKGRYVRLSFDGAADGKNIAISEFEVYGKGGVVAKAHEAAAPDGNLLNLTGGNWKIQRSNLVSAAPEEIASKGYDASSWIVATVPSTVLSSYYNVGAIPDIRYDDDQLQISESFFYSDFWYRDEFTVPAEYAGKTLTLNFDGIDWKADIWMNGSFIGHIDGAFMRGEFDITSVAQCGSSNTLAILIHKNDHPGIIKEQTRYSTDTNGGALGGDNPTFHATVGWDWIPTVRGRGIGIWNDVFVKATDAGVSIKDIFIPTDLPLPSTAYADLSPVVTLTNNGSAAASGSIEVTYGTLGIKGDYELEAGQTKDIELPVTRMDNPQLWWPKGYGEPYLYDVNVKVTNGGTVSDSRDWKLGVREMNYTLDADGVLDMYINGRRLIGNGGNWGFPEINYNYRAREYDIAVAYHADMNFTMIRNWVGMTGDEEFYEACDRYGVMVWQDFWLANPVDGPNPYNEKMFLDNAEDYVRRIRNHPSIGIYVGRNEGNPPISINNGLASLVETLHPGLYYIPHSAAGPVSGGGPYRALPVEDYFSAVRGYDRFHSERGMPNVMTAESIKMMLREENQWPQTSVWGVHDYTLENAQSCATFNQMIATALGEPQSLEQFAEYAQWINYNGYRAIFESRSWNREGLQLWMSHPCWPSMVWQTYDYYFEPTGAYFGSKKGSAPIRIQWNPVSGNVEVVNNNASDQNGLKAEASIINYDGKVVYSTDATLDSKEDTTIPVFPLTFDQPELTDAYYIKLKLFKGDELLADNFYWEGKENGNYQILNNLPKVKLATKTSFTRNGEGWTAVTELKNNTDTPALMIRLKLQGKKTGERILPAFYEDNYFSLLPGETKTVTTTFKSEDTRGEKPQMAISGFNIQ